MKKKFVLIGDPESIYIKEYIQNVLFSLDYDITLLSGRNSWSEWYKKIGIPVISVAPNQEWFKLSKEQKRILTLEKRNKVCDTFDMIDILQVHFSAGGYMYCYKKLASKSKKRIMSYWGSDILAVQQKEIDLNLDAIKKTDIITLCGKKLKYAINSYYGELVKDKCVLLDFGNSCYDEIVKCSAVMSKEECKAYWKINSKDVAIMIGYSTGENQQHVKVIEQMVKLSNSALEHITFVFHMEYGDNDSYCTYIEEILKKTKLKYIMIKEYLSKGEIAKLRLACDIFIHAQKTDCMSGSLLEYFFAGSKVINPVWLKYPELVERNIECYEYNDFFKLPELVESLIKGGLFENKHLEQIRNKISEMNSWNSLAPKWYELLTKSVV